MTSKPAFRLSLASGLWLAAGLAVAVGIAWLAWPRPLKVETDVVDRGPVARTLVDEGRTRIHDVFVVAAPVGGDLRRISLHAGDPVDRGQVVATLGPADPSLLDARTTAAAQAAVSAARAGLASAEADADLARRDQARIASLATQGFASRAALDAADAGLRAARARIAARQAELRGAQVLAGSPAAGALRETPVRSPASGQVLRILQESRGVVAAGTPLLEVGNPAEMEVVADFLSQDATQVRPGAAASLEGWGGEAPIPARVTRVEPYARTRISALGVEEQRVSVILRLTDPATAPPLGHGFRVDARITLSEVADALRVPADALVRQGDSWAVYRVDGGRARLTPVRTGIGDDRHRVVLEGLSNGDRVVLYPASTLEDGARVRP
ncbi:MAG: efflux RND transporter periplasmic adaptor subunit [Phenylobacterium sp.]|jgi:HlyD family secretion protein